jgi:hypothetical protein
MAPAVYLLCALTSIVCLVLLLRQYRRTRGTLLWWSACCFGCFALTNTLMVVDFLVVPEIDLSVPRSGLTLAGMMMLLYGLIRETT